jgi:MerR family redox-sensitive transcriptional activator SoxR
MLKSSARRVTVGCVTTTIDHTPARTTRTVSEVAGACGVAPSAVRFYEKHGVITAQRTASNQRRFNDSAACRIKVAKLAQRIGMSVREIAGVFAGLPADPTAADWNQVANVLVEQAEARTAELRARLADLGSGTKLCEIIDRIDQPVDAP